MEEEIHEVENGFSMIVDEYEEQTPQVFSWGRSDTCTLLQSKDSETIDGVAVYKNPSRVILQIASNEYHTAALTSNGDVLLCGSNEEGQTASDYNDTYIKYPRTYELCNHRITSVSVGLYHTVCVTANGVALSFGGNEVGQTGHSVHKLTKVPPSKVDFNVKGLNALVITKTCCGDYFSLFLTTTGEVYGCGLGANLGNIKDSNSSIADRVERLVGSNIIAIAAGSSHALALSSNSELYAWGSNHHGQLGIGKEESHFQTPVLVKLPSNIGRVIGISCGASHSLAWTDMGVLIGAGSNKYGQLGCFQPRVLQFSVLDNIGYNSSSSSNNMNMHTDYLGTSISSSSPVFLSPSPPATPISTSTTTSISPNKSSDVIISSSPSSSSSSSLPYQRCIQAVCGKNHSLVLTITNSTTNKNTNNPSSSSSSSFSSSSSMALFMEGEQKLYGFGSNTHGQIRVSDTISLFRQPVELTEFRTIWHIQQILYIAAGGDQSFLVMSPVGIEDSSVKSVMKKQFSTLASRSITPMNTKELLIILSEAHQNPRMLSSTLTTITEIFSSSSLLAASFKDGVNGMTTTPPPSFIASFINTMIVSPSTDTTSTTTSLPPTSSSLALSASELSIDIIGLEACYVSLLGLGNAAVVKLINAFQSTLTTLEILFDNKLQTSSSSSDHKSNTTTTTTDSNSMIVVGDTSSHIPDSILRILVIIWMCPLNANALLTNEIFPRLVQILSQLSVNYRNKMIELLLLFPSHLFVSRILKPVHEHLSLIVDSANENNTSPIIPLYCLILNWLYSSTKSVRNIIPPEVFYNTALSKLPDEILLKDFLGWKQFHFNKHHKQKDTATSVTSGIQQQQQQQQGGLGVGSKQVKEQQPFFLSNHPFLLSVDAKRRILFAETTLQQQSAQQQAFTAGMFGGIAPIDGIIYVRPWFVLTVERNNLLQTALVHIANASDSDLKMPLKVIFEGEEGIDAGGVTKEFFQLIVAQLFDIQYGLFCPTPDGRSLWINRSSGNWNLEEFHLVGVLLGLAVYNTVLLDIHLPKVFYRKLLHRTLTIDDLHTLDPEMAKGLQQLLDFSPANEVESTFCRTFEITWDVYGEEHSFELIPNGKNVPVTGENRHIYVTNYVQWLLTESIKSQFEALFNGFTRVVALSSLLLLSPDELELLMVGQPHLDFKELEANTSYVGDNNWGNQHPTIQYFWDFLHHYCTLEEKQKFLLFVTGSKKAPVGGLAKLGLKIQRQGPDSDHLPTAHTCFNTLLLPEYDSLDKLKDRLSKAISECEGFGLK